MFAPLLSLLVLAASEHVRACSIEMLTEGEMTIVEGVATGPCFEGGRYSLTTTVSGPGGRSRSLQGGTVLGTGTAGHPVLLSRTVVSVPPASELRATLTVRGQGGRPDCSAHAVRNSF